MTLESWLAFTAASTVLLIIPGPTILLVVSYALGYALVAARARDAVRNPRAVGIFNRVGGSPLIGAGVAAAGLKGAQS